MKKNERQIINVNRAAYLVSRAIAAKLGHTEAEKQALASLLRNDPIAMKHWITVMKMDYIYERADAASMTIAAYIKLQRARWMETRRPSTMTRNLRAACAERLHMLIASLSDADLHTYDAFLDQIDADALFYSHEEAFLHNVHEA